MRDKDGHEGGTSRRLRQALEISSNLFDKRADHLAAAADRPNWPRGDDAKRYPKFEAVHFTKDPELIHPLSGECLKLGPLNLDIGVDSIKAVSQSHFESLIQGDDEKAGEELRKTFLAFWRFGPEAGKSADQLGRVVEHAARRLAHAGPQHLVACGYSVRYPRRAGGRRNRPGSARAAGDEFWPGAGLYRPGSLHV
jgi:hypothetical protein